MNNSPKDMEATVTADTEKKYFYKYRWYIALLNFLQPGLGFASHKKWVDTVLTFAAYIIGFFITFKSLGDSEAPSWQIYLGLGLITISYLYSVLKPLFVISPYGKDGESRNKDNPEKRNSKVSGGVEKFWLLQFLNRLWPGLGLLVTRYWYIGLAICLLGIGMYMIPAVLWPENQMWARKILFILTFGIGFFITLRIYGYGGPEKSRTYVVIGAVALLSLLNVRFTDMIRDNFVFMTITDTSLTDYGLRQGDLMVAKMVDSETRISDGYLIVYGDPNSREKAKVLPYRDLMDRDSVFAVAVKTLFPRTEPIGKPSSGYAITLNK